MLKLSFAILTSLLFSFLPAKAASKLSGFVRAEEKIYPTKLPGTSNLNQSLQISSQLRYWSFSGSWESAIQAGISGEANANVILLSVPEIYTSMNGESKTWQVAFGRKLEFWSKVDQEWQLGLWQPLTKFDSLRPEDQGLTGVFYKHSYGGFQLLVLVSPIYLPTTTPEVKSKDGKLVADGRWYRSPSSSFQLFGQETQIVYSLDIPDAAKLVGNTGGGLRLRFGDELLGFWASANYGYKPNNTILLQYKRSLFLPDTDPQTGEVTVSPVVGYHRLYGGDAGYQFKTGSLSVSVLQDRPEPRLPQSPFVLQNPEAMTAAAVHGDIRLPLPFIDEPVLLTLDYLNIIGGKIKDYDSAGAPQGAIFEQRFDFMHAISVGGEISTKIFNRSLLASAKFTRELEQKGSWVNAELNYYPRPLVGLVLGMDLLGVDDDSNANKDTRFLNQFRANDRYYGGISYVF